MSKRKRYSEEEIINKLRQEDVLLADGKTIAETCKQLGVTNQTYYKWRKSFSEISDFFTNNIDFEYGIFGQMIVDGKWNTSDEIYLNGVNINSFLYVGTLTNFSLIDFLGWDNRSTVHMNHFHITLGN